ncbi:SWIM zinc finger family protein [Opitutales bacterium ASA1]|nr:SWIM zinc finger family protein [Opitutales bacterium ASA1]
MSRSWTPDQAASLAPDAGSLKAGQGLASTRKWTLLARDEQYLWGLAQGSGKDPYQVQIDLEEPAFKCSCPSRKFPCKHGLGLLLLFATAPNALAVGARPGWVDEWVAKRSERAAKKEERAQKAEEEKPVDAAAQQKRGEKRTANIDEGVAFLEGWMRDIARQGIASLASAGYKFWDDTARRLVDAQAPGLARHVRDLGALANGRAGWEEHFAAHLGRFHLLLSAYRRREALPPEWQAEIDSQLGWSVDQQQLKGQAGIARRWYAAAQTLREEEKLVVRTTYVFSTEGEFARILEFSHASQSSASALVAGRWFDGELVFFPGIDSLRALLKQPPRDAPPGELPMVERVDDLIARFAEAAGMTRSDLRQWLVEWPEERFSTSEAPVSDEREDVSVLIVRRVRVTRAATALVADQDLTCLD